MYHTKTINEFYSIVNYKLPTVFKELPFDQQVYWGTMRVKNKCLVNNKLYAKWKTLLKKNNMNEWGNINPVGIIGPDLDDLPKYKPKQKVLRYINRNASNLSSK